MHNNKYLETLNKHWPAPIVKDLKGAEFSFLIKINDKNYLTIKNYGVNAYASKKDMTGPSTDFKTLSLKYTNNNTR